MMARARLVLPERRGRFRYLPLLLPLLCLRAKKIIVSNTFRRYYVSRLEAVSGKS